MTLDLAIVADVFRHEEQAKHALEVLRQAGFGYDQIGIAMQGAVGASALLAFLRRAQMRPFFLSLMHAVNTQRMALTRRNRNDHSIG